MTILASLSQLYDRLHQRGISGQGDTMPSWGHKLVAIDFILSLDVDGHPIGLATRLDRTQMRSSKLLVPGLAYNSSPRPDETNWEDLSFRGRTSGRRSFLFWDKTSYVFGVAGEKELAGSAVKAAITAKSLSDHAAFKEAHHVLLDGTTDPRLLALLTFLGTWGPEQWHQFKFPADALNKNIAFEVAENLLHELPEARERIARVIAPSTPKRTCSITGELAPFAEVHPVIKGLPDTLTSGAALVSFNADAFVSYGLKRAEAASVAEIEAFKYGAALNWLLVRAHCRSFRLGESTILFWAKDLPLALLAESELFTEFADYPSASKTDAAVAQDTSRVLDEEFLRCAPAQLGGTEPPLSEQVEVEFCIVGLSPNAGRIAVRFWLNRTWTELQYALARFKEDISIEPPSRRLDRKIPALLFETAAQGKAENISPRLAGEFGRAVLSNGRLPGTLLITVLNRVRADGQVNAERAGLCKATLIRNYKLNIPSALDPPNSNNAYQLGRLFAACEYAEREASSPRFPLRVRYFDRASASPLRVFPLLMRSLDQHLQVVTQKHGKRRASRAWLEAVAEISKKHSDPRFPVALRVEEQAVFLIGYYHQSRAFYTKLELADGVHGEESKS